MAALVRFSRFVGWSGLTAVGVLHAVWAAGSPWPAKNRAQLAEAVLGSRVQPDPAATATVATSALAGGVLVAGALGESRVPVTLRRGLGLLLLARALLGGEAALSALGFPKAGKRFVELDNHYYRPFCALLGVAVLLGARDRRLVPAASEAASDGALPA